MGTKGFTLLEVIILLAITGILAGGLATVGHQVIKKEREDKTIEHMKRLRVAVMGDPLDVRHGTKTSFGYFGDMGVLPTILDNLYIAQTPPYAFNQSLNTGAGWNGPYIDPETMEYLSNLKKDYFGQDLQYTYPFTTYTDSTVGVQVEERIISPGRDKQSGTADDLSTVFFNNELYSRVSGFVRDDAGNGIQGVTLALNYPSNGSLTTTAPATTGASGLYSFNNIIPYGNRSISITSPKLFAAFDTGYTTDDGKTVAFTIINISSSSITISALRAVYQIDPVSYYTTVRIDDTNAPGTAVQSYDNGTKTVTETFTFTTPKSITGPDTSPEAVAVCVQSPVTEVPDISLLKVASKFKSNGDPQPLATEMRLGGFTTNMTGIAFTITLSQDTTIGNSDDHAVTFTP